MHYMTEEQVCREKMCHSHMLGILPALIGMYVRAYLYVHTITWHSGRTSRTFGGSGLQHSGA